MNKQELLGKFIDALMNNGWTLNGQTRTESYRTHSLAFGGGPVVTTGGRQRLEKGGIKITIGLNTICVYCQPENPETVAGQGKMAGRDVLTFRDWPMQNIGIKRQDLEDIPVLLIRVESTARQIKTSIPP